MAQQGPPWRLPTAGTTILCSQGPSRCVQNQLLSHSWDVSERRDSPGNPLWDRALVPAVLTRGSTGESLAGNRDGVLLSSESFRSQQSPLVREEG